MKITVRRSAEKGSLWIHIVTRQNNIKMYIKRMEKKDVDYMRMA
jgi:hypothetical protein